VSNNGQRAHNVLHIMDNDLDELFRALRNPSAIPGGGPVEHIETHISHVYLAGDFAYKLKKPVNFGFLDFTTRDRRRHFCDEELRLNRRLAPDWYIDVVPVCRDGGRYWLAPGGCATGSATESAVRMKRLPEGGLLDRLATVSQLRVETMDNIATQLATFHAHADRSPAIRQLGGIDAIRAPAIQNFEQMERFVGKVFDHGAHQDLRNNTVGFLETHHDWFVARQHSGQIIDGHGDLHLRNMCLADRQVVIFDCIEFNPALRAGDTMNDIGFLTMDLDHRRLPAHRNRFLNQYLEQSADYAGLPVLDFYQSYRACVRAKVSALEIEQDPALAGEARAYLALAAQYFRPAGAGLLVTCGLSGSGKTTIARQLADVTGAVVIRSDAIRKHLCGVPLLARGNSSMYAPDVTTRTYDALRRHAHAVIASGRWVILDAVHAYRHERQAAAALAQELSVPFGIVHCTAPVHDLRERLRQRMARPDVSDAGVAVLDQQIGFFQKPDSTEGPIYQSSGGPVPIEWMRQLGWRSRT